EVFHFPAKLCRKIRRVKLGDGGDTALSVDERGPHFVAPKTHGRDQPHSSDNGATVGRHAIPYFAVVCALMYSMASFTVLICSVSSSGISIEKASSSAKTSCTTASESALRSSVNDASGLTCSGLTSSSAQMSSFTFCSTDMSPP